MIKSSFYLSFSRCQRNLKYNSVLFFHSLSSLFREIWLKNNRIFIKTIRLGLLSMVSGEFWFSLQFQSVWFKESGSSIDSVSSLLVLSFLHFLLWFLSLLDLFSLLNGEITIFILLTHRFFILVVWKIISLFNFSFI